PYRECSWVLLTNIWQIVHAEAHAIVVDRLSCISDNVFTLCVIISDAIIRPPCCKIVTHVELRFPWQHKTFEYKGGGVIGSKRRLYRCWVIQKIPLCIQVRIRYPIVNIIDRFLISAEKYHY